MIAAQINFQEWFKQQPFYSTLVFTHGDRLFDCDVTDGVIEYRNLTVGACWATWQELQRRIDALNEQLARSGCGRTSNVSTELPSVQMIDTEGLKCSGNHDYRHEWEGVAPAFCIKCGEDKP